MRKLSVCLVLASLTALIWLGVFNSAGLAAEPKPDAAFRSVPAGATAAPSPPAPEDKAALHGQPERAGDSRVTTIKLPPKTKLPRTERRPAKRGRAAEKMPPTQSYPPAQVQPAPVGTEAEPGQSAAKKRGRNDNRQVTTIKLPQKQNQTPSGDGPKTGAGTADSLKAPARTDGPQVAPPETPAKSGRASKETRRRADKNRAVYEVTPAAAPRWPAVEPKRKSGRAKERVRSRSAAPGPESNPAPAMVGPAPAPEPAGSKSKKRREIRPAAPAAAALPLVPGPAAGLTPEQEMTRAYQAFDLVYSSSLGKTRKELGELWGFPMQKLGENAREVAYGFRQKGLLNLPETPAGGRASAKKKKSPTYYAANTMDPSLPGQYFSCLVVLWVDKNGRGVVVDGEAVGDCFMVETLSRRPEHFER